ncbi:MAG: DUF2892 domain-containing protein [Chloroherpetonaceae bacterium]|nr:DUF2892 domain-containing protein [Chloroherpetonaceae bacterium]MDW8436596.1 DUF2892 domain-containing protein [Chloroherpetonaceae bacterium]
MKPNIGKTDKTIRIVLGGLIFGAGLYYQSWWALAGLVPVATALINFCPLYAPFKISTAEKSSSND